VIIYLGEADPDRIVKTDWLKRRFHDYNAVPIHALRKNALSDNRNFVQKLAGTKETLVITGHGNEDEFMGRDPEQLYQYLMDAGFNHDRFGTIYLLGCNAGAQFNFRGMVTSYMQRFAIAVRRGPAWNVKIYAPRGIIHWDFQEWTDEQGIFWEVDDARIRVYDDDDNVIEEYTFEHGMLRFI